MTNIRNMLLVNHNKEELDIFRILFANIDKSITCHAVVDPVEAWYLVKSGELNPDLIILELNMPQLNGGEFLKLVKSTDRLRHLPVVIFSATKQVLLGENMRHLGAANFIVKPNNHGEWKGILKRLLSGLKTKSYGAYRQGN